MSALTRTLMLCSRSPTTWTKAARTLALACWDLFPSKTSHFYNYYFGNIKERIMLFFSLKFKFLHFCAVNLKIFLTQ